MNQVPPPSYQYERQGYSLKNLVGTIFASVSSLGIVIIVGYVVIKLLSVLPEDTLVLAGTVLLFGFIMIILIAGGFTVVLFFKNIQKPGVQAPGVLGRKLEKTLGLD